MHFELDPTSVVGYSFSSATVWRAWSVLNASSSSIRQKEVLEGRKMVAYASRDDGVRSQHHFEIECLRRKTRQDDEMVDAVRGRAKRALELNSHGNRGRIESAKMHSSILRMHLNFL